MKIGVQACHYYFKDALIVNTAWLKRHGYDCIDYSRLCDTNNELYAMPEEDFIAYLKSEGDEIRRGGIEISQVHGPWPTDDKTSESREEKLINVKKAIRGTAALGCKYIVMHSVMPYGWGKEDDPDLVERMNEDFFSEICAYAVLYDVNVCIENMPFLHHRLSTVDRIAALVKEMDLPNFFICLDTGHCNVFKYNLGDAVRECGKYLKVLHVHDNDTRCDAHTIPFDGKCDWEAFKQGLRDIEFDGVISLECHINPNYPPKLDEYMRIGIAKTAAYLADKEL